MCACIYGRSSLNRLKSLPRLRWARPDRIDFTMLLPLLVACLLPLLVACAPSASNFIANIENGTVRNVRFVGGASNAQLNLSGMNLSALDRNAFDDVADVESLDVSNNSLASLPDFVFSNLTKLKCLSLASNRISSLRNLFVGLENLRLLNISNNLVRHLRRGDLFGLTKSARILTDGNILWSISTDVSVNSFLKNGDEQQTTMQSREEESPAEDNEEIDDEEPQERKVFGKLDEDTRVKLCKSDGVVTSLEILGKDEVLADGCVQAPVDAAESRVNLREQGIAGFQQGWYRLRSLPIVSLDLSNNEIAEIREETLNDLPAGLAHVNLSGNRIRRLWSGVIANDHLRALNLKDNLLEEIEEGALARTKLRGLFLIGNRLEDLGFVTTLPDTLTALVLSGNRIVAVANNGAFSGLARLRYLNLDGNRIVALRDNVFRGLACLRALTLAGNGLATVEPAAFDGLAALRTLDLSRNSMRNAPRGAFARLTALEELNLARNKITVAAFAAELPRALRSLYLDHNEIGAVGRGSFAGAPRTTLSLADNRISVIARGAFDLPTLRELHLSNNTLTSIDGDSYAGLGQLRRLWLSGNNISEIRKGACKNLGGLYILDVSRNPFQKLENGALHGLSTATGSSLYIYENNLKEMQAGLFEDV